MKPKQAAAIFETMTDDLNLVAKILNAMSIESRANILGRHGLHNSRKADEKHESGYLRKKDFYRKKLWRILSERVVFQ